MTKLVHFLLVFDHKAGELIEQTQFDHSEAAVEAYAAKEAEFQAKELVEIVLIGSDSIETVRLTHANYFDGTVGINKWLAGI